MISRSRYPYLQGNNWKYDKTAFGWLATGGTVKKESSTKVVPSQGRLTCVIFMIPRLVITADTLVCEGMQTTVPYRIPSPSFVRRYHVVYERRYEGLRMKVRSKVSCLEYY